METKREAIAKAIYDVSTIWLVRGGMPATMLCSFEALGGRDRNLHLAYADAVLALRPWDYGEHEGCGIDTARSIAREAERKTLVEECASCVPKSWLDPLLSGPNAIRGLPGPETERLLSVVAARIRALAVSSQGE